MILFQEPVATLLLIVASREGILQGGSCVADEVPEIVRPQDSEEYTVLRHYMYSMSLP